ncbi:MAG: toxin-antitoxin system YwqK family antitoxin [Bacteroidales bacterium]
MNKLRFFFAFFFISRIVFSHTIDSSLNFLDERGLKQGFWQKKYPNGKIAYRAQFFDNKPKGLLVRYHENGKKMALIDYFDDGTAFAQLFSAKGDLVAQGNYWSENKKHGTWKYFSNTKLIREENYKYGLLDGALILYFSNGNVYERKRYLEGIQIGVYEQINELGNMVFEIQFAQGQPHGRARYYYDNNQCRIDGHYKEGLRSGVWIYYKPNGEVERHTTYIEGVPTDKDIIDKVNSDYLKSLEKQKGTFIEPEDRFKD